MSGIIESQRREIDHTLAGAEQIGRDQQVLHEQILKQNRDLREARIKSLDEMEELKRVQGSRPDEISGSLLEDRLRRISRESINLERKSYLDHSSDTLCTREVNLEG